MTDPAALVAFVKARHAELAALATAAAVYPGKDWETHPGRGADETVVFEDAGSPIAWIYSAGSAAIGGHIVLHDPRRVFRAVEVKRAIWAACISADGDRGPGNDPAQALAWHVLQQLAAEFDQHPNYQQEWAV